MRLAVAVVASVTLPMGAVADAPQARQEVPVFGTGVQVVAVPVFVTDKDGRAVAGLTQDDFELLDQGRKVPVIAFEAVDAGSTVVPGAGPGAAPVVQAAAQRQFLLLFDLMFSSPVGIMRARDAALGFVRDAVAPSDLVAAATFGQAGLRVLVGLTTDRLQLTQAIKSLGLVETDRLRDPLNLAWDLGIIDAVRPGGPGSSAQDWNPDDDRLIPWRMMMKADRNLYRQRVDSYLGSLEQLGRLLANLQGRKQLVLFSAGFDPAVLLGADSSERQEILNARVEGRLWDVQSDRYLGDSTARQKLDDFYGALAASDSVIHAIDVAGLAAGAAVDEALETSVDSGRETLAQFALNTGGRFVKDRSDLGAGLRQVLDATRYSYVLAFEPGEPARKKEKPRKLEVKLKREGLSVSHRRNYVLPDPGPTRDASVAQLQAAESIVKGLSGGPIALRVVAVPYRDAGGRTLLPVVLEADGTSLTAAAGSQLKLEVFGYALDGEGRIRDVLFLNPTLDLAKLGHRLRAGGLQVITVFAAPAGPADLRFLVRDTASGRAGSLRVRLTVPSFEGDGLVVSPPLFMDDPQARVVLPTASRMNPQLDIPFRVRDAAFTPDGLATIYRGAPREVCLLAWRGVGDTAAGPLEVTAELVGATAASPLAFVRPPRLARDADGFQRIAFTLEPVDLPEGAYALSVTLRDPRTGSEAHSEVGVEVTARNP
jgi:VWFA-related protein